MRLMFLISLIPTRIAVTNTRSADFLPDTLITFLNALCTFLANTKISAWHSSKAFKKCIQV